MKQALAIMNIDFCRKGNNGARTPTPIVQQSDPAPLVNLSEPSEGDVSIGSDGMVTIPIQGTVGDAAADIYQFGVADLANTEIWVDEELLRTVPITRDSSYTVSGDESLWRPYAYQARVDERVSFVGMKGTHHIEVRTSKNIFGNTSFQSTFVDIDEKTVPGSGGMGGGGSVSFYVHFDSYLGDTGVDHCQFYLGGSGSFGQSTVLTETTATSNIYAGTTANGPVTVTISTFGGLTASTDTFTGTVQYPVSSGKSTKITLPFSESASDSNLFVAALLGNANSQGETRVPVCTGVHQLPASSPGDFAPFLIRIKSPPEISLEGKKLYIPSQPEPLPIRQQQNGEWYATYPHSPPKVFYVGGKKGKGVNLYKPGDKASVQILGDLKTDPAAVVYMAVVDRSYGMEGQGADPNLPFIVHVFIEGVGVNLKAGDQFTINTPTAISGVFSDKNEMKTASFTVPNGVGKYGVTIDVPSIDLHGVLPDAFEIAKDHTLTVFLTFDDGPDTQKTPHFLQKLHDKNISATFFVQTNVIHPAHGGTPEGAALMAQEFAEGHSVQFHTGSTEDHVKFTDLVTQPADASLGGDNLLESYLIRGRQRIIDVTGQPTVQLARPPTGATNAQVKKSLQKLGFTQQLWDFDSRDNTGHLPHEQIIKIIDSEEYGDRSRGDYGKSPAYLAKAAKTGAANYVVCLFHDVNAETDANLVEYIDAIDKAIKRFGVTPVYAPMFDRPIGKE